MFCQNCGRKIEEGAVFCSNCGAPVQDGDRKQEMEGIWPSLPGNKQTDNRSEKQAGHKKGKGGMIAIVSAVVVLAAGVAGGVLYFTSDGYISRKNMKLAEECFDEEEYKDALTYYAEALEWDSSLTDAYLRSADIMLLNEEYRGAVRILEKGLKMTRDDEDSQELLAEKIEEVNRMETVAVSKRLQEYLDKELVPQYGYADLGAQIKEFNMDTIYNGTQAYEENQNWTGLSGIADTRICDLDNDGRDELIILVLREANIDICVYEVEDNAVIMRAECSEARIDDFTGCDEKWSMLEGESGKYLYCSKNYRGILADGTYEAEKLYRYDGENLYIPLMIECGWGSSDFVYKAYRYDANGEQLSEEILYDESDYNTTNDDWEYCNKRIEELFAECGIALGSDGDIQKTDKGYEELMAFNMWGDYRNYYPGEYSWCDTIVYHFNDWDSPLLVYDRFLRGEETLRVRDGAWYGGDRHTDWTFQDILTEIQNDVLEYNSDYNGVSKIEYAFIDCGGDGAEEMQIRFVGLDIYGPGDDSDQTIVISCKDGQLELIYSYVSWARSFTEVDYYGCISSAGSNGAGDNLFGMGYLDGNGDVQTVYNAEQLWGGWTRYISETAYDIAFAGLGGFDAEIELICYTINGEDYCVLYDGEDSWECQYFVSLCEEEGIRFITQEEIDILISRRMTELGMKETWEMGNGVYWNTCWYNY